MDHAGNPPTGFPDPAPESGQQAGPALATEAGADAALDAAPALETALAERDQARAERAELWDRFLRKQAEFDNLRKRVAREREEILQFAAMETVHGLLPVLDDFERALKAPVEGDEYRKGVELIYKRLYDALVQAGLAPIETAGQQFDPHSHQAVDTVRSDHHEDHAIVEEYQRGYQFKGRLLRPAMVKVAVRDKPQEKD